MATYTDYVNSILSQYRPMRKSLTAKVQLEAFSGGNSDVVVVAAYPEGLVLKFDEGNAFVPYTAITRFSLNL